MEGQNNGLVYTYILVYIYMCTYVDFRKSTFRELLKIVCEMYNKSR